ncbi:MAG: galactokinase [Bdellovibrionales bacterium]|nr:galactokinase [Bdellovibrionales bacterium]
MIKIKSPTRIDLSGGTLDCWPLYSFLSGSYTVNLSINIFTCAELEVLKSSKAVKIHLVDLDYQKSFQDFDEFLSCKDPELKLVQVITNYFKPSFGFELITSSESPVGGGLGGSSSLTISIIKAFLKALNKNMSPHSMVTLAHNLEAEILMTPTGTQDYYPAVQSGLNIIQYDHSGFQSKCLKFDNFEFGEKLFLVDTGKAHHSGLNNWQVIKAAVEKDQKVLKHLENIKVISEKCVQNITSNNWNKLSELFQQEFNERVGLTAAFTSPEIESLKTHLLEDGADAVKICGAGGGGCVLVVADKLKHQQLFKRVEELKFKPIKIKPVFDEEKENS